MVISLGMRFIISGFDVSIAYYLCFEVSNKHKELDYVRENSHLHG